LENPSVVELDFVGSRCSGANSYDAGVHMVEGVSGGEVIPFLVIHIGKLVGCEIGATAK
jgi:hypothetical protein